MKKINYLLLAFILVEILISCQNKKGLDQIKYYPNGNIQEIKNKSNDSFFYMIYTFYENGQIKEIHRYNKENQYEGEQSWFYTSGILDRKVPLFNGNANGSAYYFYDTSGSLKSLRYFRNNLQVFLGSDYWGDSLGGIKSIYRFNDSGNIYYKKNFDTHGNFLNEEGHK